MSELDKAQPLTVNAMGHKSYLFYGPPGTGKTTLAVKHPGRKKFYLDIDDKLQEMENFSDGDRSRVTRWSHGELLGSADGITFAAVDPRRADPYKGFDHAAKKPLGYDRQRVVTNELLRLVADGKFDYDCVIWDSLTRTSDHLVALVMAHHGATSMTETLWGVVSSNLNQYIQAFLRLPCDRIIIAHDKHQVKRNREGQILEETTRPMVVGQMANSLPQLFSEVYYFTGRDRGGVYNIQTAADRTLPARTTKGLKFETPCDPALIFADFAKRTSLASR